MYSLNKPVPFEQIPSDTNQPDGADTCWSQEPGTLARSDLHQIKRGKKAFSYSRQCRPLSLALFINTNPAFPDRRSGAVVSALILIPDWSADGPAGAREIRWAALISRLSSQYIKPLFPRQTTQQRAGDGLIEGHRPFNLRQASCFRWEKKSRIRGWRSNAL